MHSSCLQACVCSPARQALLLATAQALTPSLCAHCAERGWAVSVHFGYMQGVANNLSDTHVPQIPPRQDALAGTRASLNRCVLCLDAGCPSCRFLPCY
jgi:hypothetical protein